MQKVLILDGALVFQIKLVGKGRSTIEGLERIEKDSIENKFNEVSNHSFIGDKEKKCPRIKEDENRNSNSERRRKIKKGI